MPRTVISLDEKDKRRLDRKAVEEGVSITELIRQAVRRMRSEEQKGRLSASLCGRQRALVQEKMGLMIQKRLRNEWKRPRLRTPKIRLADLLNRVTKANLHREID